LAIAESEDAEAKRQNAKANELLLLAQIEAASLATAAAEQAAADKAAAERASAEAKRQAAEAKAVARAERRLVTGCQLPAADMHDCLCCA
jgi:hypothetical protein